MEDDPDDEALTLRALKRSNVQADVTLAHDGLEALDFLLPTSKEPPRFSPAVILLDLKMPKIGGLDVLRRLRADDRTRHLPVVVFTSSSEERDIYESFQLGASSYVRKPVDSDEFRETVGQLGAYWIDLNQSPSRR